MLNTSEISRDLIDIISKQESIEESLIADQTDSAEKILKECIQFIEKRKSRKSLEQTRKKMLDMDRSKGTNRKLINCLTGFIKIV